MMNSIVKISAHHKRSIHFMDILNYDEIQSIWKMHMEFSDPFPHFWLNFGANRIEFITSIVPNFFHHIHLI